MQNFAVWQAIKLLESFSFCEVVNHWFTQMWLKKMKNGIVFTIRIVLLLEDSMKLSSAVLQVLGCDVWFFLMESGDSCLQLSSIPGGLQKYLSVCGCWLNVLWMCPWRMPSKWPIFLPPYPCSTKPPSCGRPHLTLYMAALWSGSVIAGGVDFLHSVFDPYPRFADVMVM